MLNSVQIMGRMTRDPETRYTPSEVPVTSFSIACDRDFSGRDGEKQTDFFDVVAWRGVGEFIARNFKKGSMIAISGRLQTRDWIDRDGNKRKATEIVVENAYFGEAKRRDDSGEKAERNDYRGVSVSGADFEDADGDLPWET